MKKMQLMLDEQVQRLLSSERMVKFLHRQISDPLQCRRAHRTHVRRLLEILLNRLQIDCRINSRVYGKKDVVVFQLIDGSEGYYLMHRVIYQASSLINLP